MEKSLQNKIIKQIGRLCEKQYRKGFQQGFHALNDNRINIVEVNKFRNKGAAQGYVKTENPFGGYSVPIKEIMDTEIAMTDMVELKKLLAGEEILKAK